MDINDVNETLLTDAVLDIARKFQASEFQGRWKETPQDQREGLLHKPVAEFFPEAIARYLEHRRAITAHLKEEMSKR